MTVNLFFSELQKLILSQPKRPLTIINCENCEFCNEVYNSKNLIYCFDAYNSSDSFYLFDSAQCASCGDCDYAVESELCYESADPFKCFNCDFVNYCANLRDSMFCEWCWNGNDLFGCVNLINKSFCIFNRQLTETEYREKVKEYRKWPPGKVLAYVEEIKKQFPLTQTIAAHNENSDYGNYVHYCKNCYLCFDVAHDGNCGYLYDSFYCNNCHDLTYIGNTEVAYQAVDCANLFNCNYVVHSSYCHDSSYLFNCYNVKNSLGCVGLKNKQYCILNRQFSKEEYERLNSHILTELNKVNFGWNNLIV